MKKVILAFDGVQFSEGAFEFARCMNEKQRILLTGVFLPQVDFANLWSYANPTGGALFIPLLEGEEANEVHKNIERFESLCRKNHIEYKVHRNFSDFAIAGLTKETRFADLLILGSESFYENMRTEEPNEYLKDALHASECPVLVVPEKFEYPESNILAFDGSKSSVYAIKQFAYLFPELCTNSSLLVYAGEDNEDRFPDEAYIEELAARHFSDLTFHKLKIDPENYFSVWIRDKKTALLVSGAFGRSALSETFRESFVADVICDHKLPVFITHP